MQTQGYQCQSHWHWQPEANGRVTALRLPKQPLEAWTAACYEDCEQLWGKRTGRVAEFHWQGPN